MEGEGEGEGGGRESGEQVLSEVHLGCPPCFSGTYISHFTFPLLPKPKDDLTDANLLGSDDDGDLVLVRKRGTGSICKLAVQHSITSSLPNVGLQVWMAALLLSDYLLHRSFISSDFHGITALELGSGTGMVGIVLARIAKTVFLTDHGREVLNNCAKNVHLNSSFFGLNEVCIHVRELDWKESWPPSADTFQTSKYSWTRSGIAEAEGATLILAADVIYNDDLTESLFSILQKLFSRGSEKVMYMALEKRYNFSLDDLDVVANAYSRFRSFFNDVEEYKFFDDVSFPCFVGEQIDILKIPQYIREYERSKDLELWRIRYCTRRSELV